MARTESSNMPAGTAAPTFSLTDTRDNNSVSLADYAGKPVVIAFICNHCPYVVHIVDALVDVANKFEKQGVLSIAISANDIVNYPDDSPQKMGQLAAEKGFNFPYLYDETQSVARAFEATCTPDIYLFDANHKLYYRGQFDDTRPRQNVLATGADLSAAVDDLLAGKAAPEVQKPSVGCGIKWKAA